MAPPTDGDAVDIIETFADYQRASAATDEMPTGEEGIRYVALALNGEAGEAAEKVKKHWRGDGNLEGLDSELGDILWYLTRLCVRLDVDLEAVANENINKLRDRKERNVIEGEGDDR